jgi:hypothetical protein
MNDTEHACNCPPSGPIPSPRFRVCLDCGRNLNSFAFRDINPRRGIRASDCVSCQSARIRRANGSTPGGYFGGVR